VIFTNKHGIYVSEQATTLTPPVVGDSALPVFVGTAPIHRLSGDVTNLINRPILCNSYEDAVKTLGYSDDWTNFTLCEAIYTQFRIYGVAPAIFINIFDPTTNKTDVAATAFSAVNNKLEIDNDLLIPSTLVLTEAGGTTVYTLNTDYTVAVNGSVTQIEFVTGGELDGQTSVDIAYSKADMTNVNIVGGVDPSGKKSGLEVLDDVFPLLRRIPAFIAMPGFDSNADARTILITKAEKLNNNFPCQAVINLPAAAGVTPQAAITYKQDNNMTSPHAIITWACVKLGTKIYNLSTHLIGLMGRIDYDNGDVPFMSPSNQLLNMDGACLADGTELIFDQTVANELEAAGIVTYLNWSTGWRAWGNYNAAYPSDPDPKDIYIPVRRMFNYITNTIIITCQSRIDMPIRKILVDDIVTSLNSRLNGLQSAGQIAGGRVEFLAGDNPNSSLLAGIIKFRVYFCPFPPAKDIEFTIEYDPSYLDSVFEGGV
jgi:phage tail sheath protein FI